MFLLPWLFVVAYIITRVVWLLISPFCTFCTLYNLNKVLHSPILNATYRLDMELRCLHYIAINVGIRNVAS